MNVQGQSIHQTNGEVRPRVKGSIARLGHVPIPQVPDLRFA